MKKKTTTCKSNNNEINLSHVKNDKRKPIFRFMKKTKPNKTKSDEVKNNDPDPSTLGFGLKLHMEEKEDTIHSLSRKQQRKFFTESMNKLKTKIVAPRAPMEGELMSIHHTCTRKEKPRSGHRDPIQMVKDEEINGLIHALGFNSQEIVPNGVTDPNGHLQSNVSQVEVEPVSSAAYSSETSLVSNTRPQKESLCDEKTTRRKPRDWKDKCVVGLVHNVDYYFGDVPPSIPIAAVCCLVTTCLTL